MGGEVNNIMETKSLRKILNAKAFTLLELIMALGVLSIAVYSVVSVLSLISKNILVSNAVDAVDYATFQLSSLLKSSDNCKKTFGPAGIGLLKTEITGFNTKDVPLLNIFKYTGAGAVLISEDWLLGKTDPSTTTQIRNIGGLKLITSSAPIVVGGYVSTMKYADSTERGRAEITMHFEYGKDGKITQKNSSFYVNLFFDSAGQVMECDEMLSVITARAKAQICEDLGGNMVGENCDYESVRSGIKNVVEAEIRSDLEVGAFTKLPRHPFKSSAVTKICPPSHRFVKGIDKDGNVICDIAPPATAY